MGLRIAKQIEQLQDMYIDHLGELTGIIFPSWGAMGGDDPYSVQGRKARVHVRGGTERDHQSLHTELLNRCEEMDRIELQRMLEWASEGRYALKDHQQREIIRMGLTHSPKVRDDVVDAVDILTGPKKRTRGRKRGKQRPSKGHEKAKPSK